MSASQISQIESGGRADPAFGTVLRLARAIGISLDQLAGIGDVAPLRSDEMTQAVAELRRQQAEAARSSRRLSKLLAALGEAPDEPNVG